jgi:hypothetical protein
MELNVIKDLIPLLDANSESIVTSSAEALRLLCTEPVAEQMIVDNSGLSALVRVLSRGSAIITTKSPIPAVLGVMSQLCNSRQACDRLVKFGVIQSMKSMLQRNVDGVCQARILKLLERITTSQSQDRCALQPSEILLFSFCPNCMTALAGTLCWLQDPSQCMTEGNLRMAVQHHPPHI